MDEKCKVCSRNITDSKCKYCGFANIEALDDYGEKIEVERAKQYRVEVIAKVTDFSVNTYRYEWDSLSSKLVCERKNLKIADGNECLGKIKWSNASLGQTLSASDEQQEYPLTITYKVDGKMKEAKIKIKKIKCNDFWKFGVKINKDFTMNFYLGTPDTHTVSSEYPIEL